MSDAVVHVRISEFKVAEAPAVLKITGLGSCVALALLDQEAGLAGLAHVLLPGPAPGKYLKNPHCFNNNICKYADLAIEGMVSALEKAGGAPGRLKAKITGGSRMFSGTEGADNMDSKPEPGERNVAAIRDYLKRMSIPILSEETGGDWGRTILLDVSTGRVTVTSSRGDTKII